jgi:hypothetical protein
VQTHLSFPAILATDHRPLEKLLNHAYIGQIPLLWLQPTPQPETRRLVIWLTGFSGGKESVEPQLRALAARGFVAMSYDPYQHGERRCETQPELVARVRGISAASSGRFWAKRRKKPPP